MIGNIHQFVEKIFKSMIIIFLMGKIRYKIHFSYDSIYCTHLNRF